MGNSWEVALHLLSRPGKVLAFALHLLGYACCVLGYVCCVLGYACCVLVVYLGIQERSKFRILLYVYKSIHREAPNYSTECVTLYNAGCPGEGLRLRSSSDVLRV